MDAVHEFFQSIMEGKRARVEQLLQEDPDLVNARSEQGISAVLAAVYYNEPALADLLVERGAVLDLFDAAALGRLDRLTQVLDAEPGLVNAYATDGFQALGLASFFGRDGAVDLLLRRGAEVNSPSRNGARVMPLHSAVAAQQLHIAQTLIEHGAEVNVHQADEFAPLHGAAQNGQLEMIELLLAHGADVGARSAGGKTALDLALEGNHLDVARVLQEHGAAR